MRGVNRHSRSFLGKLSRVSHVLLNLVGRTPARGRAIVQGNVTLERGVMWHTCTRTRSQDIWQSSSALFTSSVCVRAAPFPVQTTVPWPHLGHHGQKSPDGQCTPARSPAHRCWYSSPLVHPRHRCAPLPPARPALAYAGTTHRASPDAARAL